MDEEARDLLHTLIYQPRDEAIQRATKMRDEAYQSALSFYESVLRDIEPKYHSQFIMFAEKGEASPEFLHYLDDDTADDKQIKKALDRVMEAQANSLRRLAKAMRKDCLERLAGETPDVTLIGRKK